MAAKQPTCGGVSVDCLSTLEALKPGKKRPTFAVHISKAEGKKLLEMIKCGVATMWPPGVLNALV